MIDSISPASAGGAPDTPAASAAVTPDPASSSAAPPTSPARGASVGASGHQPAAPANDAKPATRLLVEPDGSRGYVYRLVDTATGRLLAELPREQVQKLQSDPDYAAGDFLSTSA